MAQESDTLTTAAAAEAFDSVMQEHDLENGTASRAADSDIIMSDATPNRNAVCYEILLLTEISIIHHINLQFFLKSHQQSSQVQRYKPTAPNRNPTSHHRNSRNRIHRATRHHKEQPYYRLLYPPKRHKFSSRIKPHARHHNTLNRSRRGKEVMEKLVSPKSQLFMGRLLDNI